MTKQKINIKPRELCGEDLEVRGAGRESAWSAPLGGSPPHAHPGAQRGIFCPSGPPGTRRARAQRRGGGTRPGHTRLVAPMGRHFMATDNSSPGIGEEIPSRRASISKFLQKLVQIWRGRRQYAQKCGKCRDMLRSLVSCRDNLDITWKRGVPCSLIGRYM